MEQPAISNSKPTPGGDDAWVAAAKAVREDALRALNFLAKKGCDRSFLIACLRAIAWADLPRLSKDDVKEAMRDLHRAAEWTRRLEGSDLGFRIRAALPEAMADLESDLDGLARAVEQNLSLADRRGARTRPDCLAALVRHVERIVKESRDEEVSTLVSAAPEIEARLWHKLVDGAPPSQRTTPAHPAVVAPPSPRPDYSKDAHGQWRSRSRKRLQEETFFEREWQAKQARAAQRRAFWEATWSQPVMKPKLMQELTKQAIKAAFEQLKET